MKTNSALLAMAAILYASFGCLSAADTKFRIIAATDAPPDQVCVANPSTTDERIVDRDVVARWLDVQNNLGIQSTNDPERQASSAEKRRTIGFDPIEVLAGTARERFLRSFRVDGKEVSPADKEERKRLIAMVADTIESYPDAANDPKRIYDATDEFDGVEWLTQADWDGPQKVICRVQKSHTGGHPSESSLLSLDRLRIRGTPDSLVIGRDVTTGGAQSATFASADKASISFSQDGQAKTNTEIFLGTLGYAVEFGGGYTLVPYVALNRKLSSTSGKPKQVSVNYLDTGMAFGSDGWLWGTANVFTARPHFLFNFLDHSRQAGLHFEETPVLSNYAINDYCLTCTAKDVAAVAFLFDLRGDADVYTDRGTNTSVNSDYLRVGSRFGLAVSIMPLRSDITIADTWMYGPTGSVRRLNDFQASWTINLDPKKKYFGLTLSYKKGLIEATAQPEQVWQVALTGKY